MLEALLYLFRSEQGLPATEIMPLIEDSADLTEVFTKYMANAAKESPEKKWERDDAIRKERAAKKHAEDLASWKGFGTTSPPVLIMCFRRKREMGPLGISGVP